MIRFVVLVLLATACLSVKIYMFGGGLTQDNNQAWKQIALDTGKATRPGCDQNWDTTDCPRVAVITSGCADSQSAANQYFKGDTSNVAAQTFFKNQGMAPKHFNVQIDNYIKTTNVFDFEGYHYYFWAEMVDVIYFNGGDAARHIRSWLIDDYHPNPIFSQLKRKIINNEAVVVTVAEGASALAKVAYGGASSFGSLYFANSVGLDKNGIKSGHGLVDVRKGTSGLQYQQNGAWELSFSFLDFLVDTNFDQQGRLARLVPALIQLNTQIGAGIDAGACLSYKDGVGKVYGRNAVFIADVSEAIQAQSEYFHIKNVKVHYLTAGDTFDFKLRKPTTAKSPISPSITGFSDSSNILSSFECTRLLTRLIDQLGLQNLGKTQIPSGKGYPTSTPAFSMLFYKDAETKGYKSGNIYSAANVRLDISGESRM